MSITQHVFQFEKKARIELLALLLRYEYQFKQYIRQYPLEITGPGFRAVMASSDFEGFTFEGWVDALWGSL